MSKTTLHWEFRAYIVMCLEVTEFSDHRVAVFTPRGTTWAYLRNMYREVLMDDHFTTIQRARHHPKRAVIRLVEIKILGKHCCTTADILSKWPCTCHCPHWAYLQVCVLVLSLQVDDPAHEGAWYDPLRADVFYMHRHVLLRDSLTTAQSARNFPPWARLDVSIEFAGVYIFIAPRAWY